MRVALLLLVPLVAGCFGATTQEREWDPADLQARGLEALQLQYSDPQFTRLVSWTWDANGSPIWLAEFWVQQGEGGPRGLVTVDVETRSNSWKDCGFDCQPPCPDDTTDGMVVDPTKALLLARADAKFAGAESRIGTPAFAYEYAANCGDPTLTLRMYRQASTSDGNSRVGGSGLTLLLDARSGDVLQLDGGKSILNHGLLGIVTREIGSTVTEHPFTVAIRGTRMAMTVTLYDMPSASPAPLPAPTVILRDPKGGDVEPITVAGNAHGFFVTDPQQGEWSIIVDSSTPQISTSEWVLWEGEAMLLLEDL